MNILVLNCGSSSVKFQLIATDLEMIARNADRRLARGLLAHDELGLGVDGLLAGVGGREGDVEAGRLLAAIAASNGSLPQ